MANGSSSNNKWRSPKTAIPITRHLLQNNISQVPPLRPHPLRSHLLQHRRHPASRKLRNPLSLRPPNIKSPQIRIQRHIPPNQMPTPIRRKIMNPARSQPNKLRKKHRTNNRRLLRLHDPHPPMAPPSSSSLSRCSPNRHCLKRNPPPSGTSTLECIHPILPRQFSSFTRLPL